MNARKRSQRDLQPIYVKPNLTARERAAARDFCAAAYGGEKHRPKPGEFDPLWLRLGLRAQMVQSRAGWVVSTPILDETLRRVPAHDPSLPGPGWLHEVYRYSRHQRLVMLPRLQRREHLEREARMTTYPQETPAAAVAPPAQASLFDSGESPT